MQRSRLDYDATEWKKLRQSIVERDGSRCRNCGSDDELTVHHWRPIAAEQEGTTNWGYSSNGNPLSVPHSGLVTLCAICHGALGQARERVRIKNDPALLAAQQVLAKEWHNIFELWETNGRKLPFKVFAQNWNPSTDQHYLVEEVSIRNWPYGFAWGRYFREGNSQEKTKIGGAGAYKWRLID